MAKRKQFKFKSAVKSKKVKVRLAFTTLLALHTDCHQAVHKDTTPSKATFLGIAGEIRNRTYRAAIIEQERVKIVRATCMEPALLRANRQIRKEARPIYQEENEFNLIIHDFEAPTKPYWLWYSNVPHTNIYIHFCGLPIWNNLTMWLQNYHQGIAKWMVYVDVDDGPTHWMLNCFFRIVDTLKDVSWDKVETVLREAKDVGWSPGDETWIELDSDGEEMESAY